MRTTLEIPQTAVDEPVVTASPEVKPRITDGGLRTLEKDRTRYKEVMVGIGVIMFDEPFNPEGAVVSNQ